MRFTCCCTCADPGIFVRGVGGGPGQADKKTLTTFFFFFLVFSLFYRSQMVNFKEIYHFSRFQRGSNIFQGGGGGGSNCFFPIETHIICDFPGGVQTPSPPLWIRTCCMRPWLIISPMLSFAKTLHAYMTLWRRNDVRKFDADAILF